ncbi:TlpA family protein disulfide reductase [Flavobacterium quisquiliarum]|uniref:TlpA family protein disulfide reductase n=1 Tax=Flavobacterium quisquiliarum TaxID=1834436 RepID=A0ABV8W2Y9_9FLAO|nr:TlpA disulfide reductase family protein [Flavobacterium quisquiliarum]MBW1655090.1 redoxin domain-containing protein [Flavobacterium quisquiliarum]NWL02682.1 TlpA family protein disulfide reductase [Flavobacterium collinsii]
MQKLFSLTLFLFTFSLSQAQNKFGNPEVDPVQIQKTYEQWSVYQNKNIMLSRDFTALDVSSKEITKEVFLDQLANGSFIPIRLKSDASVYYYKLFKIQPKTDTSIKATINQIGFDAYKNYKMEGTVFPKFSFKDLDGNLVTNESMKGKIIVIKCWYIHCTPCIKEFPQVNKLVEEYKDRKDIIFISLAEDSPEELKTFLARKPLSYAVIPDMKEYMNEALQLNSFPTHFILNKKGLISKVLPNFESLEVALAKESKF